MPSKRAEKEPSHSVITPVLFLIYRRPEQTARVLSAIRVAKPPVLLVAADAPHPDRPEEERLCQEVRDATLRGIDWPCDVQTRFSEQHLGCRRAVAGALDWAFARHDRLIILEDDCLPDASFFPWCEALLERYENDARVAQICGSNLTGCMPPDGTSGYFSRFGPIWGWATWRRAWRLYDVDIQDWPKLRQSSELRRLCPEPFEAGWRREVFDAVHSGGLDTWDYQWAYARMVHELVNIVPAVNLIQNIGFGPGATHTTAANAARLSRESGAMQMPPRLPAEITPWPEADQLYLEKIVGLPRTRLAALRYRLGRLKRRVMAARR